MLTFEPVRVGFDFQLARQPPWRQSGQTERSNRGRSHGCDVKSTLRWLSHKVAVKQASLRNRMWLQVRFRSHLELS